MSRVFISYSSKDLTVAQAIHALVRNLGRSVFFAPHLEDGIEPGSLWTKALGDELRRSETVLCLLSDDWAQSAWCAAEYRCALLLNKTLIPIKIRSGSKSDLAVEDIQGWHRGDARQRHGPDFTKLGESSWQEALRIALEISERNPNCYDRPSEPYLGFSSYDVQHAGVFFGRGPETTEVLDQFQELGGLAEAPRLLTITGFSGSGKSSLLRAGVIPALRQKADAWIALPPFIPRQRLGTTPLDELARAISGYRPDGMDLVSQGEAVELLRKDPSKAAGDLLRFARAHSTNGEAKIVLCIDQAEELLGTDERSLLEFGEALKGLLDNDGWRAILTIRVDTFEDPHIKTLLGPIPYRQYLLEAMSPARFHEVIIEPPKRFGVDVEDKLVDRLVGDAGTSDTLPLLSYALSLLWQQRIGNRLTEAHYEKLAGTDELGRHVAPLEQVVRDAAEHALRGETPAARETLRAAFIPALVDITLEGEPIRRRALESNLPSVALPLLDKLVDARLLERRTEAADGPGVTTLEVTHEALLRRWPTLAAWIDSAKADLRTVLDARRMAESWRNSGMNSDYARLGGAPLARCLELLELGGSWGKDLSGIRDYLEQCRTLEEQTFQNARAQLRRNLVQKQELFAATSDVLRMRARMDGAMRVALVGEVDPPSIAAGVSDSPERRARLARAAHESRFLLQCEQHPGAVPCVAFSQDSRWIFSGCHDGKVRVVDAADGKIVASHGDHEPGKWINGLATRGTRLASGSQDASVRLWEIGLDGQLTLVDSHRTFEDRERTDKDEVRSVALSPDGSLVAAGCSGGQLWLWDSSAPGAGSARQGHKGAILGVAFDSDGSRLASCSADGSITVWRIGHSVGEEVSVHPLFSIPRAHAGYVAAVAFSPDGDELASAGHDSLARVWDARSERERPLLTLSGHEQEVRSVAYSPDGARIATTSFDWTVRLWEASTGRALMQLGGHNGAVHSVAFSSDGSVLATGSFDRTVRTWDGCAGHEIRRLSGLKSDIGAVAVSPDGSAILLGDTKGSLVSIDIKTGTIVATVQGIAQSRLRYAEGGSGPDGPESAYGQRAATKVGKSWSLEMEDGPVTTFVIDEEISISRESHKPWDRIDLSMFLDTKASVDFDLASDGEAVVTVDQSGTVQVLRSPPAARAMIFDTGLTSEEHTALRVVWNPTGEGFCVSGLGRQFDSHEVQLWRLSQPQSPLRLAGHSDCVFELAFSRDGSRIATACRDRHVRVFDTKTGIATADHVVPEHVRSVAFDPLGTFVVAGGNKGMLRMLDCIFSGPAIPPDHLPRVVFDHKLRGADRLTSTEVSIVSEFSEVTDDAALNLEPIRNLELQTGSGKSDWAIELWRKHRRMAFETETSAMAKETTTR